MSTKRSRSSESHPTDSPRPTAFFLAVLFAAGISTWHWYRPLPPRAAEVASGGPFIPQEPRQREEFPKPIAKWKDSGLIFPTEQGDGTFASSESNITSVQAESPSPSSLTGTKDLALEPFRESDRPLRESVATTPLPMVPVKQSEEFKPPVPTQGRLWTAASPVTPQGLPQTTADQPPHSPTEAVAEGNSPFRVPRINHHHPPKETVVSMKSDLWPDQGFNPKDPRVQPLSNSQLADKSSSRGEDPSDILSVSSNRIRTLEQDLERRAQPSVPAPTAVSNPPPLPRGPIIRQPNSKPTETK